MTDTVQQHNVSTAPIVALTDKAVAHVQAYQAKHGQGEGIRISINQTGCSGYAYKVELVDSVNPDDIHVSADVEIYIDPKAVPYIKGSTLDYSRDGLNHKFIFSNPNESGSCGCGESFTID